MVNNLKNKKYWKKRQTQFIKQLEKDEDKLLEFMRKEYINLYRSTEKELANYFQKYGKDDVIEYRVLLEKLSKEECELVYQNWDNFVKKYPDYAHLTPVRENIYKLDRLQGLQEDIKIGLYEVGIKSELRSLDFMKDKAEMGYKALDGKSSLAKKLLESTVNKSWCNGENFSARIWKNTERLTVLLQGAVRDAMIRGASFKETCKFVQRKMKTGYMETARLVYTENTFLANESSILAFESNGYHEYIYSSILDGRTSDICENLNGEKFKIEDRQAGLNFPPMHPNCRSSFEVVIDDDEEEAED